MKSLLKYQLIIENYIKNNYSKKLSNNIYKPINYILSLPAKRIRPSLCLLAVEIFDGNIYKALKPAIAIELFHNFTLIHDDIIDKASLRRGNLSINKKWNYNTAILSGDILLITSYQLLEELEPKLFYKIIQEMSQTGIKVCEGQQMDINLEKNNENIYQKYIEMIQYKTASLIGSSLKIGAILAKTYKKNINYLYKTGENIGIAFQIKDDLLDIFGESKKTGKINSKDIYTNKKNILYFKTLEKAKQKEKEELIKWYKIKTNNIKKINAVQKIFKKLCIQKEVKKELIQYRQKSLDYLSHVVGNIKKKQILIKFIYESLMRQY